MHRRPSVLALALFAFVILGACSGRPSGNSVATTAPSATTASSLDLSGPGLRTGSGWYPIETYEGQTFRWAQNDAEIVVCSRAVHKTVTVELEPGPALGSKSMSLTASFADATKKKFTVADRRPISIGLPASAPQSFRLHVDGSRNTHSPGDSRILNFRLFSAKAGPPLAACSDDVAHDGSVRTGSGWYGLETYQGDTFRWVKNDARLAIESAIVGRAVLEVEVAPGPGLSGRALSLELADAHGHVIGTSRPVSLRSYVAFTLPSVTKGEQFVLHTASPNALVPSDKRTLNFRVFDVHLTRAN